MDSIAVCYDPQKLPKLHTHRAKNLAYCRLNGKFRYFGPPGPEATQKYRAFCAALLTGSAAVIQKGKGPVTVAEMVDAFNQYTARRGTNNAYVGRAGKELTTLYGNQPVGELGPLKIKALLASMAHRTKGTPPRPAYCRGTVNETLSAVKLIMRWAVSEELCAPATAAAIDAVSGLRAGEAPVRESMVRTPVSDKVLNATIKKMIPMYGDVCRLLRWTGARPAELLGLTPGMVNRSGKVWTAQITHHKTEGKGKLRFLCFGPKAQKVLARYMLRDGEALCFNVKEGMRQRFAGCVGRRDDQKPNPTRTPRRMGEAVTPQALQREVARACEAAKVTKWTPYQLRHAAATEARAVGGLDAAQVLLGHAQASTTEIYAQIDLGKAQQIAAQIG